MIFIVDPTNVLQPAKSPKAFDECNPSDYKNRPVDPFVAVFGCPRAEPPKSECKTENAIELAKVRF